MTKTPFKLKSGNSPVKTVFFGSTLAALSRPVGMAMPKPMHPSLKGENRDDTKKKKKKKIKLKSTGVDIPTYGRKI